MECAICGRVPVVTDRLKRRRILTIEFIGGEGRKVTVCGGEAERLPPGDGAEEDACLGAAIKIERVKMFEAGWHLHVQTNIVQVVHVSLAGL